MDGYPNLGWQMIYTLGTAYAELTGSNTSTTTTITTPLISGVKIATRYAQSALLVRFSASGVGADTLNETNCKFQLLVDGMAGHAVVLLCQRFIRDRRDGEDQPCGKRYSRQFLHGSPLGEKAAAALRKNYV